MDKKNEHSGVLLMNLGSPESTETPVIKAYLDEFLMDKKVMDYPYLFRRLLVKGMITPGRSPKSAEAYKSIWWPEGSPLTVLTKRLRTALQEKVAAPVEIIMRYGNPQPAAGFEKLLAHDHQLKEVLVVPLYPHYAMASYETALEHVQKTYKKGKYPFNLTVLRPFYKEPEYIKVLSESMKPYLQDDFDYLLFSYHGIPIRHVRKGDITGNHCLKTADCCSGDSPAHKFCYRHQVSTTTWLTAKQLGLSKEQYGISFQSRLGRAEWLQPYTASMLKELPARGIKKLVVASPAFAADCLETLEEIAIEGKEIFINAGGESFTTIPCLNTNPKWIELLSEWVRQYQEGDHNMVFTSN